MWSTIPLVVCNIVELRISAVKIIFLDTIAEESATRKEMEVIVSSEMFRLTARASLLLISRGVWRQLQKRLLKLMSMPLWWSSLRFLQVQFRQIGPGMVQQLQSACSTCRGEGKVINERDKCKTCNAKKV